MNKLKRLWNELRSSLWFVPGLIVLGSIAVAFALIEVDSRLSREMLIKYPRLFGAGADGSRGMLTAIGGSMMTVAGVTFSLTLAALAQTSSQYTPRILRNFMGDRANQVVLGSFVGIFVYCLVVLRTIRGGDENLFVPSLSVVFAIFLAIVGIGFLIFFIHHIASSIQASNLIASAAEETIEAIDRLFPQQVAESSDEMDEAQISRANDETKNRSWHGIPSRATGYVQSVDDERLIKLATEHDTVLRMERGIGAFIVENEPLASLALNRAPDEKLVEKLNDVYTISRYRTVKQDAAFGVRQIVDIALKALSPGINDTTTAVTCVDYLSSVCARLAGRRLPEAHRYHEGSLRVIARGATFESMLDDSFDQIRESAEGNAGVIVRMLHNLKTVARQTSSPHRLRHIAVHLERVESLAERSIKSPHDCERIKAAARELSVVLDGRGGNQSTLEQVTFQ